MRIVTASFLYLRGRLNRLNSCLARPLGEPHAFLSRSDAISNHGDGTIDGRTATTMIQDSQSPAGGGFWIKDHGISRRAELAHREANLFILIAKNGTWIVFKNCENMGLL